MSHSFGCGAQEWPDIESLVLDAASAKHHKEVTLNLRRLLGALVARGPVRVSKAALAAHHDIDTTFDPSTNEYILTARESK